MFRGTPLFVSLLVAASGCIASGVSPTGASALEAQAADPLVIAFLDTGVNPYLPVFQTAADDWVTSVVPGPFSSVLLSSGDDIGDLLEMDEEIWNGLEPGTLYHFEGTRLLALSFDYGLDGAAPYVLDRFQHGSIVSHLAGTIATDAVLVMIQISARGCIHGIESCPADVPPIADAMEWVADQEWIDVVSVSLGVQGNAFYPEQMEPAAGRYLEASERAAASGKIVVNGAGNTIAPTLASFFNGPPWVIAVGGMENESHGEHLVTGRGVDVVSDFSVYVPRYLNGEYDWRSGTSYATPIVSGTLARALALVREAEPARVVTTQELRDALNASAVVWNATDWDPTPFGRDPMPYDVGQYANLPILAHAQMGWGYVNGTFAEEIARRVMEQDFSIPAGKEQSATTQPAWQRAREEFWSTQR